MATPAQKTAAYAKAPFAPTRFPKGVSNTNVGETLANLAQIDPTKVQTFFEDFNATLGGMTAVTTVVASGPGGLATITAAGSLISPVLGFTHVANRRIFAKARFNTATAATGSVSFGLVNATTITQGIYLTLLNGTLTMTVINGSGNSTAAATGLVYANAEYVTIGYEVKPNGTCDFFFNDNLVGGVNITTYLPTGTNLAPYIGATVANASVDYIFVARER